PRKRRHDDVTAFGPADQARMTNGSEHLVDPRPGRVDDQRRPRATRPTRRLPVDADRATALDANTRDARVRLEHGTMVDGIAHVLDHEPLRISHLCIVV